MGGMGAYLTACLASCKMCLWRMGGVTASNTLPLTVGKKWMRRNREREQRIYAVAGVLVGLRGTGAGGLSLSGQLS